jgi:RNA polymerase sigma-70 factor (ECF subfamily)
MADQQQMRDEELVALSQQGDRHCFEILVRRYMEKAYHIAFNFTRDSETAKDLSQDAFLRAYANLKQFNGRSSFYTWFYRIVVNLCLDHARRHRRVAWESLDRMSEEPAEQRQLADSSYAPEEQALAGEAKRRVNATLETMPKKQRAAFLLRNHQGLSIADVAKVMKTTEGTVRVYLHRAVAALRQSLVEFV